MRRMLSGSRVVAVVIVVAGWSRGALAQRVEPGTLVRFERTDESRNKVQGTLVAVTEDSVFVALKRGSVVRVPRSAVSGFSFAIAGSREGGEIAGILLGAPAGLLAGGVVGVAAGRGAGRRALGALIGAGVGAIAGAIIGGVYGHHHPILTWYPVPDPSPTQLTPPPPGGDGGRS